MEETYRVIVANSFDEETAAIIDYIRYKLQRPMAAQRFDDILNKMIDTLGAFPKSHKHWIYEDDNGI